MGQRFDPSSLLGRDTPGDQWDCFHWGLRAQEPTMTLLFVLVFIHRVV
jgi:hypothetical protein